MERVGGIRSVGEATVERGGFGKWEKFFVKKKNENKMTCGKKTEERRMKCACVEGLFFICVCVCVFFFFK
jgi:hypothetical protein